MKRRWVSRISPPFVRDYATCQICQEPLGESCAIAETSGCMPPDDDSMTGLMKKMDQKYYDAGQRLWLILLMLRNRRETLFSWLDISLITRIFNDAMVAMEKNAMLPIWPTPWSCRPILSPCDAKKHVFHACCFNRWLKSVSPSCPTCRQMFHLENIRRIGLTVLPTLPAQLKLVYVAGIFNPKPEDAKRIRRKLHGRLIRAISTMGPHVIFTLEGLWTIYFYHVPPPRTLTPEQFSEEVAEMVKRAYLSVNRDGHYRNIF